MASASLPTWLRGAPLGAIIGFLSSSVILMGSALNVTELKSIMPATLSVFISGCFLTALGEFNSASAERDSQLKETRDLQGRNIPKPFHATAATFVTCLIGIIAPVPIASVVPPLIPRISIALFEVTIGLVACGWLLAWLGKTPVFKSIIRVVIGGWIFMGVSSGLTFLDRKWAQS